MEYVLHYDTSSTSSIGIIILVCVPEAQGIATYCEFSRLTRCYALTHAREGSHAVMHLRMPEKAHTQLRTYACQRRLTRSYALTHARENRHSHDALIARQGRSQHGARGGGAIAPPILGVAPPIGSCPGHSRKPAFGNGAIAS